MLRLLVSLALVTVLGVMLAAGTALTATNTVPSSRMAYSARAINANALKPSQCSGLNLTRVVVGTAATIDGTSANELILGTSDANTINGMGADDCMLGGD